VPLDRSPHGPCCCRSSGRRAFAPWAAAQSPPGWRRDTGSARQERQAEAGAWSWGMEVHEEASRHDAALHNTSDVGILTMLSPQRALTAPLRHADTDGTSGTVMSSRT